MVNLSKIGLDFLGAIIKEGRISTVFDISEELFTDEEERKCFHFVRDFVKRYNTYPDFSLLKEEGINISGTNKPIEYLWEKIITRYGIFVLTSDFSVFSNKIKSQKVDEAISFLQNRIERYNKVKTTKKVTTAGNEIISVLDSMESYKWGKGNNFGVLFGWDTLDAYTRGAMGGDFVVLVGRPSLGKTYILLEWCRNAYLKGNKCLFISMEMSAQAIATRLLSLSSKINTKYIRDGRVSTFGENILYSVADQFTENKNDIHIMSGGLKQSTTDILSAIQLVKPDIVYIDAGYLVSPDKSNRYSGDTKHDKLSDVAGDFKSISLGLNIPIIATVQFNRRVDRTEKVKEGVPPGKSSSEIQLGNIYGTDVYGQLGSVVIGIGRGLPPHELDRRLIKLLKNREGEVTEFEIEYSMNPVRIGEILEQSGIMSAEDESLYQSLI